MADFKVVTPDFLKVYISTSKDDISFNEKRFPKDLTISDLKVNSALIFEQTNWLMFFSGKAGANHRR